MKTRIHTMTGSQNDDQLCDEGLIERTGIDPSRGAGAVERRATGRGRPWGSSCGSAAAGQTCWTAQGQVSTARREQRSDSTTGEDRGCRPRAPEVIVLDSFAVLALLRDEPAAAQVQELIEGEEEAALTVLGVSEVIDQLVRLMGADEDEAVLDLAQLGLASPSPVEAAMALHAGLLRARHYHRRSRAVSLADCIAAETARPVGSQLATADPHLLELCREEGIALIALPDSTGQTWSP